MNRFRIAYRLRGWLMVPPMIFITLCTWAEVEQEYLVFGLGGAIFAAGFLLRLWSQIHLHYRLKIRKTLTTTGPYAFVRNPIYIGNMVMFSGACFLAELFWFAPIMVLYCAVVYAFVVRHEESHLFGKYGTPYQDYMNCIPRWFPRLEPEGGICGDDTKVFLYPSILAELPCLLLLIPFIMKELLA